MSDVVSGAYTVTFPVLDLEKIHKELSDMLMVYLSRKITDIDNQISDLNDFNDFHITKKNELETRKKSVLSLQRFPDDVKDVLSKYKQYRNAIYFGEQDTLRPYIDSYLQIASRYFALTIYNKPRISDKCGTCGMTLLIGSCSNCGTNQATVLGSTSPIVSPVDNSENLENLINAFHRLQGVGGSNIPYDLYNDVRKYLASNSKPHSKGVLELSSYTEDMLVQTHGTSLKMLESALSKSGYSAYYGDMYIIARNIWGWKLPTLSHIEQWIINTYKEIYKHYHLVKGNRSSCINVMSLLYELLRKANELGLITWLCKKVQFKMVSDPDIQAEYTSMIREMFRLAGIENTNYRFHAFAP
jgi:hypothetical protein